MGGLIKYKYPLFLRDIKDADKSKQSNIIEILHKELIDLRNNNKLVPGQQYRITDYVATTSDVESRSANHPFDIIVTADNTNILNENARAIQHEGDEYFKHCNLAAWKLKYCIDNDTNRFLWAFKEINGYEFILTPELGSIIGELISDKDNTIEGYNYHFIINFMGIDIDLYTNTLNVDYTNTNEQIICYTKIGEDIGEMPICSLKYKTQEGGKGVIYEMIDEHNNRAPYDFKGIQFKRYNGYVENYPDIKVDLIPRMPGIIITNEDNPIYAFLCCTSYDWNIDTSIGTFNYSLPKNYYISDYCANGNYNFFLLPNVILDTYDYVEFNKVYIGNNSHNITIKVGSYTAIIEDGCCNIISSGGVNIKRNCENLINVYECGEDTHYIIISGNNEYSIEPLYRFNNNASGYYKLNIPQEVKDFDRYKIVNVWKSGDKLCWYHPEIGIINSDV